jgi:5-formyltetrahydrofolate cyclo-ligase
LTKEEKEKLRKVLIKKRSSLPKVEIEKRSQLVQQNLFSLKLYQKATWIMFYLSLPSEVNTDKMLTDSLRKGKKIAVPVIRGKDLIPCLLTQLYQTQIKSFGLREPLDFHPVPKRQLELIIVPGCGFDLQGYRLGFGQGYYDRFLKDLKGKVPLVGLAFDFQVLKEIPHEKEDVPLDFIVSEKKIYCAFDFRPM